MRKGRAVTLLVTCLAAGVLAGCAGQALTPAPTATPTPVATPSPVGTTVAVSGRYTVAMYSGEGGYAGLRYTVLGTGSDEGLVQAGWIEPAT